jgi:hypothetical protein
MKGKVWGHHRAVQWLDNASHSLYCGKKLLPNIKNTVNSI